MKKNTALLVFFVTGLFSFIALGAAETQGTQGEFEPAVVPGIMGEARKNSNWKRALVTGKDEQVVLMNISPKTNPNNEIGSEVHTFDQVILIAEGNGRAILNGKPFSVTAGDIIFIPQGIPHNVVNLGKEKELKLISFYSKTDIPKDAVYKTKAEESVE